MSQSPPIPTHASHTDAQRTDPLHTDAQHAESATVDSPTAENPYVGTPPFAGPPIHWPPTYGPPSAPPAPEPRRSRTLLLVAVAAIVALLAGIGGGAWAASRSSTSGGAATATSQLSSSAGSAPAASQGSVEQVAASILPSVVSVLSSSAAGEGEGSGVVLSADGLILTNNHVIDGATTLTVSFNDGTTATATVVGADATDDLAVIKAEGVSGLTPAVLGSSANLVVGQDVIAVGSPLGLSATVTSGIVSALNRPVATSDSSQQQPQQIPGLGQSQQRTAQNSTVINAIQTDAAINPGNSGGPLVDLAGQVVGINSAIASLSSGASGEAGSIGVGFAIPIDQAKRIADEIISTGTATHAVLGASVTDATLAGNELVTTGATISQLTADGAAAAAGLAVGDVITELGGLPVESSDALVAAVRSAVPNTAVDISYERGGQATTVSVTLGSATG